MEGEGRRWRGKVGSGVGRVGMKEGSEEVEVKSEVERGRKQTEMRNEKVNKGGRKGEVQARKEEGRRG